MCSGGMCGQVHAHVWVHVEAKDQHRDHFFSCFQLLALKLTISAKLASQGALGSTSLGVSGP